MLAAFTQNDRQLWNYFIDSLKIETDKSITTIRKFVIIP